MIYESTTTADLRVDGDQITATQIIGTARSEKSGINLLDDVDIFNLLCIPSFNVDESPESSVDDLNVMYDNS